MSLPIQSAGRALRDSWSAGPVLIPGVFCPLVAKLAEKLGFRAVYLSGGALSAGNGVPDIGLLTLSEFVTAAGLIVSSTRLPLLCDADTGFGEALQVERCVQLFERAGAAGIHLEDQQMPKRCGHLAGKSLISAEAMAAKIRAAVASRKDRDFVIIARTDARGVTSFEDSISRAKRYLDAGADAIFPEAMESAAEFELLAKHVSAPLLANMTEFGKGPNLDATTLGEMGYKMILFPLTAFRSAMRAAEETLADLIKHGHQRNMISRMQTRQQLYDLLGYSEYEQRDQGYFRPRD